MILLLCITCKLRLQLHVISWEYPAWRIHPSATALQHTTSTLISWFITCDISVMASQTTVTGCFSTARLRKKKHKNINIFIIDLLWKNPRDRWQVDSPYKRPIIQKMILSQDTIMLINSNMLTRWTMQIFLYIWFLLATIIHYHLRVH